MIIPPRRGLHRLGHQALHLVKRFWWAVTAGALTDADERWVATHLGPGERELFARLSRADQEHHLRVARRFCDRAGVMAPREWVAAALLHDVGKLECGLGTVGRVWASVWPFGRRGDGRLGRYRRHEVIGAMLVREAGGHPDTVALIAEWPEAPRSAAAALKAADDL